MSAGTPWNMKFPWEKECNDAPPFCFVAPLDEISGEKHSVFLLLIANRFANFPDKNTVYALSKHFFESEISVFHRWISSTKFMLTNAV